MTLIRDRVTNRLETSFRQKKTKANKFQCVHFSQGLDWMIFLLYIFYAHHRGQILQSWAN
jgi:hypothetical protein